MEHPRFPALALVLLLAIGALVAVGATTLTARAEPAASCQPVEDVALSYTPTLVYPDTPVLFTAEVISGSLPITYTWDLGDVTVPITGTATGSLITLTHGYTATGVFSVTLSAWNTCTLPPLTTTVRVTVAARPCLTLTGLALTYVPTQVYTYTPALFTGEIVTGSLPVTYTWAFGDGTPPLTGTTAIPLITATHIFTGAQVYTVTLGAWNSCTITPALQTVTLSVAPCEVISDVFATYWPTAAQVGQVITFTSGVTGGSPPSALEWSFGDGTKATGAVVTHAYTAPLTYTLALTAANPCSQQTATATLQIAPWRRYGQWLPLIFYNHELPTEDHLGYGANIASADHVASMAEMGFDWAKGFVAWSDVGAGPNYNWVNVDNQLAQFVAHVDHVLLRINGPTPGGIGNPPLSPSDLTAFQNFAEALANHVSSAWRAQGLETIAYEIWNEPNLDYEWGWLPPDPAQYTALLKRGYLGLKAGDPQAIVVSAGMATTGDSRLGMDFAQQLYGTEGYMGDLAFIRGMYDNGAKGFFDALGSHPYGGSYPPETSRDEVGIPVYFRRAEEHRQVMLDYNDDVPVWATEFGWVLDTYCDLGYHNWMKVSEALQAQYLVDAYAYADEHWLWMGPMFIFNQDFATVSWYDYCEQMRWYSITYRENPYDPGNSPVLPRQAFGALRDMPKHSAW